MDRAWWAEYVRDVRERFQGKPYTIATDCHGIPVADITHYRNSGAGAIALAEWLGAERIILLGYDCQHTGGKKHWHGDHPVGLGNAGRVKEWPLQFAALKNRSKATIVNASRETALKCFDRVSLDDALSTPVLAVLRSGGWCGPEHAQRLAKDLGTRANRRLTLITDMDVTGVDCIPLKHGWAKWWSKLEICRPDIHGDVLYLDLDTMVFGDIEPLMVGRDAMLGDFYRPKLESGVMYLTAASRKRIWERFTQDPAGSIRRYVQDGKFFAECLDAADLRKLVPGLHSHKVHGKRDDTRLLIFHGEPRPDKTEHW